MVEPIKTPHIFTLNNGQTFICQAHYRKVDSPLQADPVAYIETYSQEKPNVIGATLYHSWSMKTGPNLTAWYVPEQHIESVAKI